MAALLPAAATARPDAPARQHGVVDLRDEANVTIVSARPMDHAGWNSAPAGDVNGDGVDDVIVGAPGADGPGDRLDAGAAYVVFGRRTKAPVRRASLTARGFRILGPVARAGVGTSVAPAGDVDGDGLDDVVVGSTGVTRLPDGTTTDGTAWIVHGRRTGTTVDLAQADPSVTKLVGPPTFGRYVAGGRDVDGDRRPDVAVAAPTPQRVGARRDDAGVFVVRGGTTGQTIDVRHLGDRGVVVRGIATWVSDIGPDGLPLALTLVQDMNGDGRAEIGIGFAGVYGIAGVGTPPKTTTLARVVYGRAPGASVDVAKPLGRAGFVVEGRGGRHGMAEDALSGDGDVNGDGRGDLVVGDMLGQTTRVLFGGRLRGTVAVEHAAGLTITGREQGFLGDGAAIVGDVNGDGLDDVLTGDHSVNALGRRWAGAAYLVYGQRSAGRVDSMRLGTRGFWLAGAVPQDQVGFSLASAGDFNGDGRADLLLGASWDAATQENRGVAHIVYGFGRSR